MNTKETKAVEISINEMDKLCGGNGFAVISRGSSLKQDLAVRPGNLDAFINIGCQTNVAQCLCQAM